MAAKSTMLFDVLNNILIGKSVETLEKHLISPNFKDAARFMILRYLSMSPNYEIRQFILDNYISLERMPEAQLYRMLLRAIPRQRSGFIKYIR